MNKSNIRITVFTPTYNRGYCLSRAYDSLVRQSCRDFKWLVIDDGSTDNTRSLVESWQHEGKISISYIYKENGGMHTAHNEAYRNIDSELCMCLDSDDMLTDDCIEQVLDFWNRNKGMQDKVAGFIALDGYISGGLIGTEFPEGVKVAHENWLLEVKHMRGDKKIIYRTKIAKEAPEYPEFPDEKYGSMGYKNQFIDAKWPWLLYNKIIYLVEYLPDGSSMNMYRQYRKNLKGWDVARKSSMILSLTWRRKFAENIHYVSNSIFLKKLSFIHDSPTKFMTILAIPFGIMLNVWVRFKTRNIDRK